MGLDEHAYGCTEDVCFLKEAVLPVMQLDSAIIGVDRLKSLLYAIELIMTGESCIEGEELDSLKNLIDMCSECVRGIDQKMKK